MNSEIFGLIIQWHSACQSYLGFPQGALIQCFAGFLEGGGLWAEIENPVKFTGVQFRAQ
ncbi:hypothetical protein GCM10007100_33770 [Roseibacillus persicicus]|uniref:Uncharacterized protein n=1 Tax=Roseibacillus persicicus TaxID=454148 RepID=A0A918TUQ2_9BACT|nr:hypothetical protein GCM10007100_33770 [Roseibacillus persicicus]